MRILKYLTKRPGIIVSLIILALSVGILWRTLPGTHTYSHDLHANQIFEGTVKTIISEKTITADLMRQNNIQQDLLVEVSLEDTTKTALVHNDLTPLKPGAKIYVRSSQLGQPDESFDIVDVRRQHGLFLLFFLFVGLALLVGGRKGLQAIIGLVFSMMIIFSFIIPGIIANHNAIIIGFLGSLAIVIMNVYLTDGFNYKSTAALIGIFFTLVFTTLLTMLTIHQLHFSGYTGEDSLYFTQETGNKISLIGILIAGIGLSALGVLADVAVTQVSTVLVLARAHHTLSRRQLFVHAMEVGHDHIAAVINTLALAYIGASLPLLLLLTVQKFAIAYSINIEDIATEIVRILVSTSALILVVPITTIIATFWAHKISEHTGSISDPHIH